LRRSAKALLPQSDKDSEEQKMNSDLTISSEQIQADVPVTVFRVRGWLDAQSEEQLLEAARTAHDGGARYLLIDLSDLDTLTSAGMRALQKVYQIFTPKEDHFKVAHLKLCNAPPQIYNVLGITGFLQNIPMYESQDTALQSFGKE
jgi:anti-anti-sigma factor